MHFHQGGEVEKKGNHLVYGDYVGNIKFSSHDPFNSRREFIKKRGQT